MLYSAAFFTVLPLSIPVAYYITKENTLTTGLGVVFGGIVPAWLRYLAVSQGSYTLALLSSVCLGIGAAVIMFSYAVLGERWFSPSQRSLAVTIAVQSNYLGWAAGSLLLPNLVSSTEDFKRVMFVQACVISFNLLTFVAWHRERPLALPTDKKAQPVLRTGHGGDRDQEGAKDEPLSMSDPALVAVVASGLRSGGGGCSSRGAAGRNGMDEEASNISSITFDYDDDGDEDSGTLASSIAGPLCCCCSHATTLSSHGKGPPGRKEKRKGVEHERLTGARPEATAAAAVSGKASEVGARETLRKLCRPGQPLLQISVFSVMGGISFAVPAIQDEIFTSKGALGRFALKGTETAYTNGAFILSGVVVGLCLGYATTAQSGSTSSGGGNTANNNTFGHTPAAAVTLERASERVGGTGSRPNGRQGGLSAGAVATRSTRRDLREVALKGCFWVASIALSGIALVLLAAAKSVANDNDDGDDDDDDGGYDDDSEDNGRWSKASFYAALVVLMVLAGGGLLGFIGVALSVVVEACAPVEHVYSAGAVEWGLQILGAVIPLLASTLPGSSSFLLCATFSWTATIAFQVGFRISDVTVATAEKVGAVVRSSAQEQQGEPSLSPLMHR